MGSGAIGVSAIDTTNQNKLTTTDKEVVQTVKKALTPSTEAPTKQVAPMQADNTVKSTKFSNFKGNNVNTSKPVIATELSDVGEKYANTRYSPIVYVKTILLML